MHASFKKVAGNAVMQRGGDSDTDYVDSIKQRMVIRIRCRIVFLGYGGEAVIVTNRNTNQGHGEQLTVDPHLGFSPLSQPKHSNSPLFHYRVPPTVSTRG